MMRHRLRFAGCAIALVVWLAVAGAAGAVSYAEPTSKGVRRDIEGIISRYVDHYYRDSSSLANLYAYPVTAIEVGKSKWEFATRQQAIKRFDFDWRLVTGVQRASYKIYWFLPMEDRARAVALLTWEVTYKSGRQTESRMTEFNFEKVGGLWKIRQEYTSEPDI